MLWVHSVPFGALTLRGFTEPSLTGRWSFRCVDQGAIPIYSLWDLLTLVLVVRPQNQVRVLEETSDPVKLAALAELASRGQCRLRLGRLKASS